MSDPIHDRYQEYYNQTQTQKDLSKTDYTYAHSFSYNESIDPKNICEWFVPNMSRRALHVKYTQIQTISSRSEQNSTKKYSIRKFSSLLLISSMVLMGSRYYPTLTGLLSQNDNHLRSLTGDPNPDFNQLIREIKELKDSNNELKLRMKSNDFEENERFNNLNHKIDSIDDYLNNIMKNCCRNETDEVLALIDLRLSSFMASIKIK